MQNQKFIHQYKQALAGVELLSINAQNSSSYEELQKVLNDFVIYINRTANEKNNRPNKNIIAFTEYFKNEADKKRDVKTIEKKAQVKKLSHKKTYKDFIPEYLILRKRGHSFRSIAKYSEQFFKVKVSKSTIEKICKEEVKEC